MEIRTMTFDLAEISGLQQKRVFFSNGQIVELTNI
jgi:hypothetical protein